MDPIYHFAPNPFPANLREELSYPCAPWLVSRELFKRLAAAPEVPGKLYKKIELQPDDPEAMFVQRYYEHNPPRRKGIRRIYVIHASYQTDRFEAEIRTCDQEAVRFNSNWSRENEAEHRDEAYADWQRIADQFTPLEIASANRIDRIIHARVLPLWHGTSQEIADSICESGFTFFGKHHLFDPNAKEGKFASTDAGFFGSGIYFTDSPSYAAKYSKENILMLAFIAIRTPFPIVGDVPHPAQCSDMRRFMGKELYQEYNAHFIPVASIAPGRMEYYPCQFEQPECNEYVIKSASQTLARYQVEIGDAFPLFHAIITQGKNNLPLEKKKNTNEMTSEILVEKLRAHYTAMCTDLPLPMSEATFPLKELFTQLAILESKVVEQKEKETENQGKEKRENSSRDPSFPERDSLAEAMAHLQETMTPIKMEELFAKRECSKEPKKVLLIGRAGIGKSTLIDRITIGWTEGEMFPQFNAVFRLVLRELNDFQEPSQNLHWLAAAISHSIYKNKDRFHDVLAYIQQYESRILILLDGLDEASPELIQKFEPLLQMPSLHILISSRPGVPVAIKNRTDRQIENTGFSRNQIEDYATKFFARVSNDANQTTPFLNAIRGNQNLLSLAHTPLQLQMLCTLWETGAKDKGFGSSLTALYTEMFEQLYLWHTRKQNPYADPSDLSIDKKLIGGLGKVALIGLESRQLLLSESTLRQALQLTDVTIAQLRATGVLKKSGKAYTFFHLTFQEYLIACYVSLLSNEEQWNFIRNNRHKHHYRFVISFLAGHIYQSDGTEDKRKTKHFFETLFSAGADLAGYAQLELILRSAAECPALYEWVNVTFGVEEALKNLLTIYIDVENEVYSTEILKKLSQLFLFRKIDAHNDWLINKLKQLCDDQDGNKQMRALKAITALTPKLNIDDDLLDKIVALLTNNDCDNEVRIAATETLGKIGTNRELSETVISEIIELFGINNALKEVAVDALIKIGTTRGLSETITSEIVMLLYETGDIQGAASEVLRSIEASEKLNEKLFSIIDEIIEILADNDVCDHQIAVQALRAINVNVKLDDKIIFRIFKLLTNNNEQEIIEEALVMLDQIAASGKISEEIISKIAEPLTNGSIYEKIMAIAALENIGVNVKIDEPIISKIAALVADPYDDVQEAAIRAVGNISANVKLNESTISKIFELLADPKVSVRIAATEALGKIAANVKLNESIISKIVELLTDPEVGLAIAAAKALGKITANVKLNESIISKIVGLLTVSEDGVRSAAIDMLEKIAANVKLNESIISKIVELLADPELHMRRQAIKTLRKIAVNAKLNEPIIYKIVELLADPLLQVEAVETLSEIDANRKLDESIITQIAKLLKTRLRFATDRIYDFDKDGKMGDMVRKTVVAHALGKIAVNRKLNQPIISKIVKLLADPHPAVRFEAAAALGKIAANVKLNESDIFKIAQLLHDDKLQYTTEEALRKIPLQNFVQHSLVNVSILLDQAFLRQTVVYLDEFETKVYLVILEKEQETRVPLPEPEAFIEIVNQRPFIGSFVSRYSNNEHFKQLTFFREKEKKRNYCLIQ